MNEERKDLERIEKALFVDIGKYVQDLSVERDRRIDERFAALAKALDLQAVENQRRLSILNGEFERDRKRQQDFVSAEKWEATNTAEREARDTALTRVNEKFEDYIKRYEIRQHEVDNRLQAQENAAKASKEAAANAAQAAKTAAEAQGRKSNRNLGITTLALAVLVFLANILPTLVSALTS